MSVECPKKKKRREKYIKPDMRERTFEAFIPPVLRVQGMTRFFIGFGLILLLFNGYFKFHRWLTGSMELRVYLLEPYVWEIKIG